MGIRKTKFIKGNYYHIYNRGCNKDDIFFETQNYIFLLDRVKKYKLEFNISIIAYCLMPNHYHLLVRQDSEYSIATFIQRLFNSYSKAINKKYNRSGTLFEGKYNSILVDEENYLLHLCRYIHRNPLEANLVERVEDWKYSNYPEYLGNRKGTLFDMDFILERFGNIKNYKEFVEEQDEYKKPVKFDEVCFD